MKNIGFVEGSNILTFPEIGEYNNKQVTINGQNVSLEGIVTTVVNLQIEIDSVLGSAITISNFTFGKNCCIGSSLINCEYDSDGILTIKNKQSSPFKFNKINISGSTDAIGGNNVKIIIQSDDHELNVSGGTCGIMNAIGTITINNFGTINIRSTGTANSYGIINMDTLTINNFGTMTITSNDDTGITCSTKVIIDNSGIININSSSHGINTNSGVMTINNSGTIIITTINDNNYGIHSARSGTTTINNSGIMSISSSDGHAIYTDISGTTTINNSSIVDINGNIYTRLGILSIEITDSLFSIETSSSSTSIGFTSTPSSWNGRTFTNNSDFSGFTKASICSYLDIPSSITLQSEEQIFNKLKNESEELVQYKSKGTLILQPKSSLEVSEPFKLPEESTLICSGDVKINNSVIRGESSVLLKSNLKNKVLNDSVVSI